MKCNQPQCDATTEGGGTMWCGGYAERPVCIAHWLTCDPEDRPPYEEFAAQFPVAPEVKQPAWSTPRPGARPRR